MPPTAECSTRTATSSVEIFSSEPTIASSEPCTSRFDDDRPVPWPRRPRSCENICSSVPRPPAAAAASRRRRWRKSAISRARLSFSTTTKSSPASGRPLSPSTSIGVEGPASSLVLAALVDQRAHPAPFAAGDEDVADIAACRAAPARSRPGRGRARAWLRARRPRRCGSGWPSGRAARPAAGSLPASLSRLVFFSADTSTSSTSPPSSSTTSSCCSSSWRTRSGLRVGPVHLVDRDDDRHLGRLGVADRLDGLLHDAVIGGDDQHDDVGDVGAARAHRGEGLMARRVDEGDLLAARRA